MNSTSLPLNGAPLRTYETLFLQPISNNLEWPDIHTLFRAVGTVHLSENGDMKLSRNGQDLSLYPMDAKLVSESEQMELRHFLDRSGTDDSEAGKPLAQWLLVIDHREARIYRTEMDAPVAKLILPHNPEEYFRHEQDSKEISRGSERPNPDSYFQPVAKAMEKTGPILIFGSGKGMGSEMEQFIAWARLRYPDLAARVIGTERLDLSHLTEGELLVQAREFYSTASKVSV